MAVGFSTHNGGSHFTGAGSAGSSQVPRAIPSSSASSYSSSDKPYTPSAPSSAAATLAAEISSSVNPPMRGADAASSKKFSHHFLSSFGISKCARTEVSVFAICARAFAMSSLDIPV